MLYENLTLQWTKVSRDLCLTAYPALRNRIYISGGVGFDRYKIYRFMTKVDFCTKYRKSYNKVIGIAGWGFDLFDPEYANYNAYVRDYGERQCERFRQDGVALNRIYTQLIKSYPDVLFILKEHPGVLDPTQSELYGLSALPNVVYIQSEEKVEHCIAAADVWIGYESTTCLEAWLLGKQTAYINPSGPDFKRHDIYQGMPVFETYEQVREALDAFYKTGVLPGFVRESRTA